MTKWLDKLNLRPQERRWVVMAVAVLVMRMRASFGSIMPAVFMRAVRMRVSVSVRMAVT